MNGRLVGLLGLLLVAACAGTATEEADISGNALSGEVAVGTVVETTTSLRIRRDPSQTSDKNILGLLPPGTKVKVLAKNATNGFYNVEVQDAALVDAIGTAKGWCFGDYLLGKSEDPETKPDTGTNDDDDADAPAATLKLDFESKNCRPMKDDNGAFMKPTIDDFVINAGGKVEFAAMEVSSASLPYGTMLHIPEIDALPAIANKGRSVRFKVVKTNPAATTGAGTVTLCTTASGFLPAKGTKLTIEIEK